MAVAVLKAVSVETYSCIFLADGSVFVQNCPDVSPPSEFMAQTPNPLQAPRPGQVRGMSLWSGSPAALVSAGSNCQRAEKAKIAGHPREVRAMTASWVC